MYLYRQGFLHVVSRGTGRHMGAEGSVQRIHTGAVGATTVVADAPPGERRAGKFTIVK